MRRCPTARSTETKEVRKTSGGTAGADAEAATGPRGSLYQRLRRAGRHGLRAALDIRRHAASDPRACISYLAARDGQKFHRTVATSAERRKMLRAADMIDALIPDRPGVARAACAASDRHGVPRYALAWYYLVRTHVPRTIVETGVSFGTSTFMILAAIEKNGVGQLHSIDDGAGIGLPGGVDVGYLVPNQLRRHWLLVTGSTASRLKPLFAELGAIDMFVHDSAHVEDVMSFEYEAAWAHLTPGGILASDDVNATDSWQKFTARHSAQIGDSCTLQEMARPSDSEYLRPTVAYCVKRSGAPVLSHGAALHPAEPEHVASRGGGPPG